MSAIDELRRLLDERCVEWWDSRYGEQIVFQSDGVTWFANDGCRDGMLEFSTILITPEQAIAATLGRGECEIETTENWLPAERYHRCKNCGAFFAVMNATGDIPPCVCPNCGKAVKR
jgi:hypothetical protein